MATSRNMSSSRIRLSSPSFWMKSRPARSIRMCCSVAPGIVIGLPPKLSAFTSNLRSDSMGVVMVTVVKSLFCCLTTRLLGPLGLSREKRARRCGSMVRASARSRSGSRSGLSQHHKGHACVIPTTRELRGAGYRHQEISVDA